MTDDERFDRLALAIERVADSQIETNQRLGSLEQAHLGLVSQVGILTDQVLRVSQQQEKLQRQQDQRYAEILQRQAEQDQRFDILLGEIRHIVQQLEWGSQP